jgi:hypothetical protein
LKLEIREKSLARQKSDPDSSVVQLMPYDLQHNGNQGGKKTGYMVELRQNSENINKKKERSEKPSYTMEG